MNFTYIWFENALLMHYDNNTLHQNNANNNTLLEALKRFNSPLWMINYW